MTRLGRRSGKRPASATLTGGLAHFPEGLRQPLGMGA